MGAPILGASALATRQLWKFPSRSEPKEPPPPVEQPASKSNTKGQGAASFIGSVISKKIWPGASEKAEPVSDKVPVADKKSPYDLDFVLSKIPDKILDSKMKESLQDLAKLGEGIYSRIGKQPDHPIVLNIALLRMYALQSHVSERAAQEEELDELTDEFRSEIVHYFKYASEVYEKDPSIPRQDILLNQLEDDKSLNIPRHVVFVDHLTKSIVIAIRGTKSISDLVTDLYIEASPFMDASRDVFAHRGIAESAEALLPTVTTAIRDIQQQDRRKYKNYRVVTTGHSLGAGSAALLAILLSTESKIPVTAFAFAPPPIISQANVNEPRFPFKFLNSDAPCEIHSFVNDRDFITRCSHRELLHMLSGLVAIDALPWTDFERSSVIFRNKLSDSEMKTISDALAAGRQKYDDDNDTALYVPGNIYVLRPIPTIEEVAVKTMLMDKDSASQKGLSTAWQQLIKRTSDSVRASQTESTTTATDSSALKSASTNQQMISDSMEEGEKKQEKQNNHQYALVAVPRAELLFNGLLYYGDSMVSDHLLSSYRRALLKLAK